MKKLIYVLAIALTVFFLNACTGKPVQVSTEQQTGKATVYYTCPMHPEVKSDKPGKCPKCGMDLEKKEEGNK